MPNTVQGLPFGGQTPQQPNPLGSIAQLLLKQGVNQGLKYGINQTGLPNYLGNAISSLFGMGAPAAGSMAASLGLPSAAAGIASEGGGFGADAAMGGLLGGMGGLGSGLIMAPLMIGALGGMLQGHANSLFGYRPAGWSAAHAKARTAQQDQSMNFSNALINASRSGQNNPNMPSLLAQIAIPKSAANMGLFRALDEGMTENRGAWPQQAHDTSQSLTSLFNQYRDQLDPGSQVGLLQSIYGRMGPGQTLPTVPSLTPDQYKGLNWETQLFYNQQQPNDPYVQQVLSQQAQATADREMQARLLMGSGGGANY